MTRSPIVRVAVCHDQAEATLIRTILSAHGIDAMIPEGGSSAGVAAVGFRTHVFVASDDAEQAAALIAEMRDAPPAGPAIDDEPDEPGRPDLNIALERRTRVGAIVLIAVLIQFGTGHMTTGAWKRGLALAGLELAGIRLLWDGSRLGTVLVVAAVLLDVVGAITRTYRRASPGSRLPVARVAGLRGLRESGSRVRR